MKLLLLCLGLTLVCAYNEGEMDVVADFDPSKVIGKWYTNLLAANQQEKIEENGTMRIFLERIDVGNNSSLLFTFHLLEKGECVQVVAVCNETNETGIYTAYYEGDSLFSIADVKYDEYLIILFRNEKKFQAIILYGRQPDVENNVRDKYVQLCNKHGIIEENIVDMTEVEDPCPQYGGD